MKSFKQYLAEAQAKKDPEETDPTKRAAIKQAIARHYELQFYPAGHPKAGNRKLGLRKSYKQVQQETGINLNKIDFNHY